MAQGFVRVSCRSLNVRLLFVSWVLGAFLARGCARVSCRSLNVHVLFVFWPAWCLPGPELCKGAWPFFGRPLAFRSFFQVASVLLVAVKLRPLAVFLPFGLSLTRDNFLGRCRFKTPCVFSVVMGVLSIQESCVFRCTNILTLKPAHPFGAMIAFCRIDGSELPGTTPGSSVGRISVGFTN